MTQHTALAEPSPASPPFGTGYLSNLIVTLLAPIFLSLTGGDVALARMAAAETLEDYRIRTQLDPIAVGQIVLNGLAASDSLVRSMADDLPLMMVLRLRSGSIGLNRVAEQNRKGARQEAMISFLVASRMDLGPPAPVADRAPEEVVPPQAEDLAIAHPDERAAEPAPADHHDRTTSDFPQPSTPEEKQQRRVRVMAMVHEVADLKASLRILPEAEHEAVETRIAALDGRMQALLTGSTPVGQAHVSAYASG